MELWSRRKFFLTSLAGSALAGTNKLFGRPPSNEDTELALATLAAPAPGQRPLIISSANGLRSEEHTSELQSRLHLVCRLLLEKKKKNAHAHRDHANLST